MRPRAFTFLSPIHKASRQIGLHLAERMAGLGLASQEGHLLSYLRSYAPCPISELHRVFGLKRSTLTSMLDRLEKRGLVRREICPDDRRSFLVHLTDDGRRLAEEVRQPLEELERQVRSELREQDLHGFERVMQAIARVTRVEVRDKERT